MDPPWTLTGGAALVGFHTQHRTTRDLDLFWQGKRELSGCDRETEARLVALGWQVRVIQRSPAFCRLLVKDEFEDVVLDLVADPVPTVEEPLRLTLDEVTILVDTRHEILVNKVCALLSRSEPRDLLDVRILLLSGGNLERALREAPMKDTGFSSLTLAWALQNFPVRTIALRSGVPENEIQLLERFNEHLIEQLTAASAPE